MDNINWDDIYLQLYAYTHQLVKNLSWFRKDNPDSFLKGKQIHDYVGEAIEKYLLDPGKYDPSSGRSLVTYLKWHIIRSSVGNDVRSAENRSSSDLLSRSSESEEDEPFSNIETLMPFIIANFDDEIDYKKILGEILEQIEHDEMAKLIFEEVRCNGYDRRDVLREYKLQEKDYDNGMKRLKTILRGIAKEYNYG